MTGVVSRSKFVDAESNDVTLHVRVDADLANRGEERHIRGNIEIHCVIIIGWEEDEMRKDQHHKKNVSHSSSPPPLPRAPELSKK